MSAVVLDLDVEKTRRILAREGQFLTYRELVEQIERTEHEAIERAIVAALAQPEVPDFHLEPDDDLPAPPLHVEPAREPSTLPPCGPVAGGFEVASVQKWRPVR